MPSRLQASLSARSDERRLPTSELAEPTVVEGWSMAASCYRRPHR